MTSSRARLWLTRTLVGATLTLAALAGPVLAVTAAPPAPGRPVLVVVAPWSDGAAIVRAAGGRPVGPSVARLGLLATSDRRDFTVALRRAGALAVTDGATIATLCGVPT
jgi:hypothetical protein